MINVMIVIVNLTQMGEKFIDSLIDIINESDSLIFEKSISDNIKKYKLKIIDLIIDNDYIELISKLKKIFESDKNVNFNIIESLEESLNDISLDSINWLINNESEILTNCLIKVGLQNFLNLVKSDNFVSIYKLIKLNKNVIDALTNKIISLLDNKFFAKSRNWNDYDPDIFKNYDKIILLTDLYINYKKKKLIVDDKLVHLKIMNLLVKNNLELKVVISYKNHYKIKDQELKEYFEKNAVFENFIKNSSVDTVNWFFEIASVLAVIKSSNYKNIFSQVCGGGNLELIKLVYNLIQCAGYKIDNGLLKTTMDELIWCERWSNAKNHNDCVIFEFINMGVKPPSKISKYNDYYKNITIIKK